MCEQEVDGRVTEVGPVAGFGISDTEHSGSSTRLLVVGYFQRANGFPASM